MKFEEGSRATKGHGSHPKRMGAEPRQYGDPSVFDTLVVRTVNDGCRLGVTRGHAYASTSPGKQPQGRGPNEIGGSLLKRWSMWFNSTIHGAPYPPQSAAHVYLQGLAGKGCPEALHGCRQLVP